MLPWAPFPGTEIPARVQCFLGLPVSPHSTVVPPPGKDALHLPARHSSQKGPRAPHSTSKAKEPTVHGHPHAHTRPRPLHRRAVPGPAGVLQPPSRRHRHPRVSDPWLWSGTDQSAASSRHSNTVPSASQAEATSGQGHAELTEGGRPRHAAHLQEEPAQRWGRPGKATRALQPRTQGFGEEPPTALQTLAPVSNSHAEP